MPQTIRLEFAKSNTKVSKPKPQPNTATTASHPALMHHSLDVTQMSMPQHHQQTTAIHPNMHMSAAAAAAAAAAAGLPPSGAATVRLVPATSQLDIHHIILFIKSRSSEPSWFYK
ncbi:Protein couch potato [Eumeta japonica]|uniref:Protein couch potato n=1 Tax=Eumeta variegata TaxID=151549 RepID=A0A4C1TCK0_EUMVA|nr:Protein couch potato [Eumeta japonica]